MSTHRTYLEHPTMWIRIATVALVLGAPLAMAAKPVLLSPSGAIESSTNTVTEQLVEGGLFMARSCEACRSLPLRLNAQTELYVGQRQVSVAELNKFLSANGPYSMLIVYDKKASTLTRLVVDADLYQRPAKPRG
ncbi:MAG TPA: hypothetical protein VLD59_05155 [Steroidobacteraceae bacterium]|nr:hypothetical protein [Steroidobacteraceae bacterium]